MTPKVHLIPVTEKESVELLRRCSVVEFAFGLDGCALRWVEGEPLPEAVQVLELLRGVSNQNMQGAGI